MVAVCFACGESKNEAMEVCASCGKKPGSRDEKIASFALSDLCLKERNLVKGSEYIKKKRKLPRFHQNVEKKAIQLVESYIDFGTSTDEDSFQLSESFFDFAGVTSVEKVMVHVIGKAEGVAVTQRGPTSKMKTYHTLEWEVDKDVSQAEVDQHLDAGALYIWYRWMGEKWQYKFVDKAQFDQLRQVEV